MACNHRCILAESLQRAETAADATQKKTCMEKFENVRRIRNDVMHFDPDGIPERDLQAIREFARFLQRLQIINV